MTQANDPRFSRPQPPPYGAYPQQQGQGTVVMSRSPQAALAAEPATLVYRPNGGSSYPPPQSPSQLPQPQHQQMQQQMQQQGYSQRPPIQPYAQYTPPQQAQGPASYAPPQQAQAYAPPQQRQAYVPPTSLAPSVGFGFAGMTPSIGIPGMDKAFGQIQGPTGMPAGLAFGFGIVAAVVALVFDVIFLNVNVPGIGGYAWYLSTALTFAAAGFAGAKLTKATRKLALTAIGVAGAIYGVCDLGMGIALEHMPMGDALFLGIQGVAIAIFTGSGGVYKGLRARG